MLQKTLLRRVCFSSGNNIFQQEDIRSDVASPVISEKSNYQGVSEEFIFGIVLPEEESAVAVH